MRKWFKWVLLVLVGLIFIFFIVANNPIVFIPHDHVSITLPFHPKYDSTTGLIPMGEKFEHPDGDGHPGIDFGFQQVTPILAVADGRVGIIRKNQEGSIDLEISHGFYYKSAYKEMNSLEPNIKFGSKVKQGQIIGYAGFAGDRAQKFEPGGPSGQIHWEFSSSSMLIDRLCPVGYFDSDALTRVNNIWTAVPAHDKFKQNYPDICSGVYKGRED